MVGLPGRGATVVPCFHFILMSNSKVKHVAVLFLLRHLKTRMAYRASFWINFVFDTLVVFMQVYVWRTLLADTVTSEITAAGMTTYVALSHAIRVLTRSAADSVIEERLGSGDICFDLVRPLSFRMQMVLGDAGRCLTELAIHAIPSFAIVAVVFGVVPPSSVLHGLLFLALTAIGIAISFYIKYLIGLIGFFFLKASHLAWFFGTIEGFLSGQIVPLWFYPPWLQRIADAAPFKLIFYTPISVYLGKTSVSQLVAMWPFYLFWILLLFAAETLLWKSAIRRIVVQGG